MLTHLRIKNFKAWEDSGDMRLAPLTVIFGANSAGKSSLGHLLLALKQTVQSVDRHKALHLGDRKSLIDLGTYEECVHKHDISKNISFEIRWMDDFSIDENSYFNSNQIQLNSEIELIKKTQKILAKKITFKTSQDDLNKLDITYSKIKSEEYDLSSRTYPLKRTHGRVWGLKDAPEKFYHINERSRSRFQGVDFISDLALKVEELFSKIYHLGPLREPPSRFYQWAGDTPENVGQQGENTIAAILSSQDWTLHREYYKHERKADKERKTFTFPALIAKWLKELGLIQEFSVKPIAEGRKEYEVLIRISTNSSLVKITDVGFGISQVLPALVQAFYTETDATVLMEQPEIHLHPQVQAGLADVFIEAIRIHENGEPRNVQLIIESHSEHFLTRLQRRIAEEVLSPEEVAIYFVDNKEGKATIEELRINEYGEIENWPENFFGDEMGDLAAQALAAIERRQRNQAKG